MNENKILTKVCVECIRLCHACAENEDCVDYENHIEQTCPFRIKSDVYLNNGLTIKNVWCADKCELVGSLTQGIVLIKLVDDRNPSPIEYTILSKDVVAYSNVE